jgi:hypothetical protein
MAMAMSMSENKAVEKIVKELKKGRKQKGLVSVSGIIVDKATRNIRGGGMGGGTSFQLFNSHNS